MKLIIDIPKEVKEAFDKADDINFCFYDYNSMIGKAIQNGIPLPKGHGRLGDLDALAHKMCMADIDDLESEEVAGLMLWFCDKASTIIETDKENEG